MRPRSVLPVLFVAVALIGLAGGCASRGFLPSDGVVPSVPASLAHDLGRRAPGAPVDLAVFLKFNDEQGLYTLVDQLGDPASGRFRHFLTPEAFDQRYAPSRGSYRRLLAALRAGGFTVTHEYADRTEIEARAPARVAERFFATRVDDFDENRYGRRYANVTAIRVPPLLSSIVSDVEMNSIVFAREADAVDGDGRPRVDVIENGGFERRGSDWKACSRPEISTAHPFAGTFDLRVGSAHPDSGTPNGLYAVCQKVTVPNGAVLGAYTLSVTNVTKGKDGYQEIGLMSQPGKILKVLSKGLVDKLHWKRAQFDLRQYAGQDVYVFFGVYGRNQKQFYDTMYVDDVSLTGVVITPPPSGSPSPVPPGPGKPLAGPTYGPNGGWAPYGIAAGFDLPVQHGYDGRGTTVGIVTQSTIRTPDLAEYLSANGIKRRGKINEKLVAGSAANGDPTEGMMEIEAIAALAPGANVIDYEVSELTDLNILDAYHAVLADNKAAVLNSSFDECASADPTFDAESDRTAVHAAALGITFVASSGDTGSACYDTASQKNVLGATTPAGDPHFIGVGGTESIAGPLASSSPCPCPISTPIAWDDHNTAFGGLSGGGVATHWKIPSYQIGVSGSPASTAFRNVPDIAYPAVDDDLRLFDNDQLVDGTSWSSAIAASLLAGTVEICGRIGFANPAIYRAHSSAARANFVDVVSGFNGRYVPAIPQGYNAGRGYDDVSGLGMPQGFTFALAMCGRTTAP